MMPNPTKSLRLKTQREDSAARVDEVSDAGVDKEHSARDQQCPASLKKLAERSIVFGLGQSLTRSLAAMAVVSCIALLAVGATPFLNGLSANVARWSARSWGLMKGAPLSALPLLLAGASYIILQALLWPRPLEMLKRLMLGSAFVLWGITQLMPAGPLTTELGNVVIALYVIDLGLIIRTDLRTMPAN
jgi:hypothetical protein